MTMPPTALERAFELARSGAHKSVTEIRKQLKAEGLSAAKLTGPALMRQLRELCQAATRA